MVCSGVQSTHGSCKRGEQERGGKAWSGLSRVEGSKCSSSTRLLALTPASHLASSATRANRLQRLPSYSTTARSSFHSVSSPFSSRPRARSTLRDPRQLTSSLPFVPLSSSMSESMDVDQQAPRSTSPLAFPSSDHPSSSAATATVDPVPQRVGALQQPRSSGNAGEYLMYWLSPLAASERVAVDYI